ncbi:hypothetical protein EYF80_045052 [Liparis tanakae]|uniref:Uncharacterized protein n=1 Tax=Liparis tanakae TaxID=230148 RepID=A0A4Z2FWP1_9TELE|nr:hypothetical protein EYF80_045052 [Liparis tanakae]
MNCLWKCGVETGGQAEAAVIRRPSTHGTEAGDKSPELSLDAFISQHPLGGRLCRGWSGARGAGRVRGRRRDVNQKAQGDAVAGAPEREGR